MNQQTVIVLFALGFGLLLYRRLWPRRQSIKHKARNARFSGAWAYVIGFAAFVAVSAYSPETPQPVRLVFGAIVGILGGALIFATGPKRPRYISKLVRREVIVKWERETGRKYNRRIHDIDHIVPFSRGGSHTADNLRVLEKDKNRSKGNR